MAEKNYDAIAEQIVELVGGKENVLKVTHCITRCRLVLKDPQVGTDHIADVEAIDGVLKVIEGGGQYQVCIGTDVNEVYDRVCAFTGKGMGEVAIEEVEDDAPAEKKSFLSMVTTAMGSIFMPLMGAMVGCGMVSAITTILMVCGIISADSPTYTLLHDIGMSLTYFLPVVIGASAGKYFGLDMWIGAAIGAALMYPTINNPELLYQTVKIFGFIPMQYQAYQQTVFPSIISVMLAAMLRSKDAKKKEDLLGYILTNIMGVGEPGLYGFIMQHKEAMGISAIAAGIGCATFTDDTVNPYGDFHYAQRLHEAGVPCELHVFEKGSHGLSLSTPAVAGEGRADAHVALWAGVALDWLDRTFAR